LVFSPAKDQAADLGPLVVEEDKAGLGPIQGFFLAVHQHAGKPGMVRNDEPRRAVRLDDIDALDGYLVRGGALVVAVNRTPEKHQRQQARIHGQKPVGFRHGCSLVDLR
jgi:hypothetical protein